MKSIMVFVVASLVAGTAAAQSTPKASATSSCRQIKSLAEFKSTFAQSRIPALNEIQGSWVQIGFIYPKPRGGETAELDCAGVKYSPEKYFSAVLLINGTDVDPYVVGGVDSGPRKLERVPDGWSFTVAFGGEHDSPYACRLTSYGTLACSHGLDGNEFVRMRVEKCRDPEPSNLYCAAR